MKGDLILGGVIFGAGYIVSCWTWPWIHTAYLTMMAKVNAINAALHTKATTTTVIAKPATMSGTGNITAAGVSAPQSN